MNDEVLYDGTSGDPTVIWYDPGGASGWAVFSVHPDSLMVPEIPVMLNVTHFACGEFYGTEFKMVDAMIDLAEAWPGAALGSEHFVMYDSSAGRKDEELLSLVRLNAALRYGLYQRELIRAAVTEELTGEAVPASKPRFVYRQTAKLAFDTVTEERLKAWGYWEKTAGQKDARAAVRHALCFLKRLKTNPKLRAEVFPALASGYDRAA